MNPLLQQLLSMGPGLGAAISGDGAGMQAFMRGFERARQMDEQRKRLQQQDQFALQDRQTAAEDRQRLIQRQAEADTRAADDQQWQDTQRRITMANALTGAANGADTVPQAETSIDAIFSALPTVQQMALAPVRDNALRSVASQVSGRNRAEIKRWVKDELQNAELIKKYPDTDPDITAAMPERIRNLAQNLTGQTSFRKSDIYKLSEMLQQADKPSDEPSLQSKEVMVGGKPTMANYNPKTGKYTDSGGQELQGVAPIPPRPAAGDEPIAPDDVSGAASAILAGRMAPSQLSLVGGMGSRGVKFKQAVVAEVNKQNPTFNWQQAEAGFQYGKSPGTQTTVRYLDNVAKTIPMLREANRTFQRSNVRFINDVIKSGKSQFGNVDVADFDFKKTLLADEIAKVLQGGGTGSGTSDAKLKQAETLLAGDLSPAQFATVLDAAEEMLKVRRGSLTSGTFMEQPETPTATEQWVRDPKTGKLVKKGLQ